MGTWYSRASSSYSRVAHHRADVPGRNESLHAVGGRFEQQADGRRHQHVRNQHREIVEPFPLGLPHRHRIGRRRGLKPHREEYYLPLADSRAPTATRPSASTRCGHRRRGIDLEQVACASRARAACRRKRRKSPPESTQWRWPYRRFLAASRRPGSPDREPVRFLAGSSSSMPVAHQRMGLAAADLHQHPRPRHACGGFRATRRRASSGSRYSSRYFIRRPCPTPLRARPALLPVPPSGPAGGTCARLLRHPPG